MAMLSRFSRGHILQRGDTMSYRIVYGRKSAKKTTIYNTPLTTKPVFAWSVAIVIALIICWGGWKYTNVWQYITPGDPNITCPAIENMLNDIRNGTSVSDAVSAFCQEIIHNAERQ